MTDQLIGLLAVVGVLVGCALWHNARRFTFWAVAGVVIVGGAFVAHGDGAQLANVGPGAGLIAVAIAAFGTLAGEPS